MSLSADDNEHGQIYVTICKHVVIGTVTVINNKNIFWVIDFLKGKQGVQEYTNTAHKENSGNHC